ncbi:DUF4442 domain-containing protein [Corynebacterium bovis]|uniref:DUF4442 domain-containing protein n=2 Tax=Corynebacterium bovis TaxID=36808 RepID=A0A426PWI9_9CORY|nr:DUF4442 domain-containing protein [Corynebacterium bovis]WJY78101.1 hypothetical protein CBOVI_08010 [Corynebacterium bovis DSM 20582 = CIP 54.80]MDH2456208.1 DUF4442 domain-containing protein [Corynebacterium bovis]QQC48190.1 DUF4442 domain-containing protein [Corynebacterium bovis]RRO81600.1 DUF4442 domain-containing protein [Corynebacterium bovis]RRO81751.1 DUF4442 domain-containing protein [Corynebacterium bovis]
MAFTPRQLRVLMRIWPPYLGAGVRLREFADDGSRVVVTHRLNRVTANALGTVFGGTMLSMTDPFYVLMGMQRLGSDYRIWDTETQIAFVKPGRGRVTAVMEFPDEVVEEVRRETAGGEKYLRWFESSIVDDDGSTVARLRKQVYFRRRTR